MEYLQVLLSLLSISCISFSLLHTVAFFLHEALCIDTYAGTVISFFLLLLILPTYYVGQGLCNDRACVCMSIN